MEHHKVLDRAISSKNTLPILVHSPYEINTISEILKYDINILKAALQKFILHLWYFTDEELFFFCAGRGKAFSHEPGPG